MAGSGISTRLAELKLLRDGWLDGAGAAPSAIGLEWLEATLSQFWPANLPTPRIYPAPEGTIVFEWTLDSRMVSLEIDLEAGSGYFHLLDVATGVDEDATIDLHDREGWANLESRLAEPCEEPLR